MGVLAAFIFAAQAINFPVAAATSGHLIGAALAAILLGPWLGMLTMTAVVSVQALVFQDGGLLALGWNLFNMAALACFAGDWGSRRLGALQGRAPAGAVAFRRGAPPAALAQPAGASGDRRTAYLLLALGLALLLSPLASASPDGLQRVAQQLAF